MRYHVKLKESEVGYSICCPGLPGCWSQGESESEALENIKDAISDYITIAEELSREDESRYVEIA